MKSNEQQDANKRMKDDRKLSSLYRMHYNGLMTDFGLIPSLNHLEEHSLQEHTLLHLCVIVSNLAEMFFVVTLAKRLYSLFFLPSFLLLAFVARACAHYRSFVFLLSQVSQ